MVRSSILRKALVVSGIATSLAGVAIIPADDILRPWNSEVAGAQAAIVAPIEPTTPTVETLESPASQSEKEAHGQRFEEIMQVLQVIPTGRAALKVLEDYDVTVVLESGQGSYYLPSDNHIVIDSGPAIVAALDLVHEATHARYQNEGKTPDPSSVARGDYVARLIEEEAEGQANAIQAKIELEAIGVDVSEASPWFEMQYRRVYRDAVQLKRMNPKASEAELQEAGTEAGRNRLIEAFTEGKGAASTGGPQYPAIYGMEWDAMAEYEATQAAFSAEATAAGP